MFNFNELFVNFHKWAAKVKYKTYLKKLLSPYIYTIPINIKSTDIIALSTYICPFPQFKIFFRFLFILIHTSLCRKKLSNFLAISQINLLIYFIKFSIFFETKKLIFLKSRLQKLSEKDISPIPIASFLFLEFLKIKTSILNKIHED